MKSAALVLFFVAACFAESPPQPVCGAGEVFNTCSGCDASCRDLDKGCAAVCGPPRCECRDGYVRNDEGKCIPLSQCSTYPVGPVVTPDMCGIGEVYDGCGGCSGTCEEPNVGCLAVCTTPACQCKPGFVRNKQGRCIPRSQCPLPPVDPIVTPGMCQIGEYFNSCGGCSGTCEDPNKACNLICAAPACQCRPELVRDESGRCIPPSQCKTNPVYPPIVTPGMCGIGEIFNSCGGCSGTCENPIVACPAICAAPACQCKPDFVRDESGRCIPQSQCKTNPVYPPIVTPGMCGIGEIFDSCGGCSGTCENPIQACPLICAAPACQCKPGFVRNESGRCIPQSQCRTNPVYPPIVTPGMCGIGEVYDSCGGCSGTCENPIVACPAVCGPPRCQCKPGFVRNKAGVCIPQAQCKANVLRCGLNEVAKECGSYCDPQCDILGGKVVNPGCPAVCVRNCNCAPGHARFMGICLPQAFCSNFGFYKYFF